MKLSDYINNIYKFTRPYERYYSACTNIYTDINIIYTYLQMERKGKLQCIDVVFV